MLNHTVRTLVAADDRGAGPSTITRLRGAVLMVLGPLIALAMLWTLVTLGPALLHAAPGSAPGGTPDGAFGGTPDVAFGGMPEQATAVLVLLPGLAALGLLFTWGGWNLWRHGRLGRAVAVPAAVLVAALLAAFPWLKALFA